MNTLCFARSRLAAIGLAALALVLASCASLTESDPYDFESAPLYGMVYGYDKQPISGARLTVNGEPGPTTDLEGRFVIPDLARGSHTIVAEKRDHESATAEVDFLNLTQVLYMRLWSTSELIRRGEDALAAGRLDDAATWIDRAAAIDADNPELRFLTATLAVHRGEPERSVELLQGLLEDRHAVPEVRLFLADVYQYELEQPGAAAEQLRAYLRLRRDARVEERFEGIGG